MTRRWQTLRFGEIAEFRNGLNYSPDDLGPGVRIIGVPAFQHGLRPDYDSLDSIRHTGDLDSNALLRRGDLVFVRSNGSKDLIGRCMIIDVDESPVSHSGFTIRARLTSGSTEPLFIAYFFQSMSARKQIHRLGGGTNISNLSQDILANIVIPVPPITIQRRIATIATTFDEALAQSTRVTQQKAAMEKALGQRLLTGELRFREFRKAPRQYRLRDLFTERRESGRPDLPLLSVTAHGGLVYRDSLNRRDTSPADKSRYLRVCPGDIVYNTMRMWQGVSALASLDGIVSPAYTVCTPTEKIDGRFAARLFGLPALVHRFYQHSQGLVSDTWNLKFPNFGEIAVLIPDLDEQRRIADVLDALDEERALMKQRHTLIERQKWAVMHELFAGEVVLTKQEAIPEAICKLRT